MFNKNFDSSELFFKKIPAEEYYSGENPRELPLWYWFLLGFVELIFEITDVMPHEFFCEILYYFSR